MITTENFEKSIALLLSAEYPRADIFYRDATQTNQDNFTFVIHVDLSVAPFSRDYQSKEIEIVIQFFIENKIVFNRNFTHVRDILMSKLLINSIPIYDENKAIIKHLFLNSVTSNVVDDVLSVRATAEFIDDTLAVKPNYPLMGNLELNCK